MFSVRHRGSFRNLEDFIRRTLRSDYMNILHKYGAMGVNELGHATPKGTGMTAQSWTYKIIKTRKGHTVTWANSNTTSSGTPIVVLLHYGHGTNGGGYVQGRDFINPTVRPIFDRLANELWEEVTRK